MKRATRRVATLVASVALLIQMVFAAPVAFRMAADMMAMPAGDMPMCSGMSDMGGTGDHQSPQPQQDDRNDKCPLCHSGCAVPLALAAAIVVVLSTLVAYLAMSLSAIGAPSELRRFDCYASRAPPAAA
jgi:hypothetical protein